MDPVHREVLKNLYNMALLLSGLGNIIMSSTPSIRVIWVQNIDFKEKNYVTLFISVYEDPQNVVYFKIAPPLASA